MKVYLYDVFHRCESIADWTPTTCSLSLSSTQKIEGKYSIKMTTDAGLMGSMRYERNLNWSEFKTIIFSVYHPGWTNEVGNLWIVTDDTNYKYWTFNFAASWTEITIDLSSAPTGSMGTLDLSNITRVGIAQVSAATPGEDYYFDFFRGRSIDVTNNITYLKITEEMGMPSWADLKIKGESLDHFNAGLEMEVYDKDDVLSWTGRILYPESVMEGTEVVGKLKAIGSNSQFNNIYRKNFTTVRDSDYIAKDVIDNALPKFTYDDEIDNFTRTYKYDMKTKIQKMFNYLSTLERAVIHNKPDGEIFFNKYDNLSKGPQIYQGTYNFRDDDVGDEPSGWTATNGADCTTTVIASLDGHKKVLKITDDGVATSAIIYNTYSSQINPTVELWIAKSSIGAGNDMNFTLLEGGTKIVWIYFSDDNLEYLDGDDVLHVVDTDFFTAINALVHLKLVLDDTANTFDCYRNGVLLEADLEYNNNSSTGITKTHFMTRGNHSGFSYYIDGVGYSWDANYDVGDNLKCWDESTSKIKITSYTPAANRHITRTPVIGANNSKGQVYYMGKATDAAVQKYGLNFLQDWKDSEITNYVEAKQLGDNLQIVYSIDTQMIQMLVVGKGHLQVGKTLNLGWVGVFSITQHDFLLTKRIWYPMNDISEIELTDNILTRKAFNVRVINKFYDEDAQQSFEEPDVSESTMDGTVISLVSVAKLRTYFPIGTIRMFSGTWVNNSTIPGWYMCDGNNGTVDLVKQFIRGATTSGGTGGSDDAIVVSHKHTVRITGTSGSETKLNVALDVDAYEDHSTSTTGVSGTDKNIPAHTELIFIQRIS